MKRFLPLAALLAQVGCWESPAPAYSSHISVESRGVLAQEPSASFSVTGALEDFQALAVGPDNLALLDYPQSRVVLLDVRAGTARMIGRHGGGPGEFQNPRFLVRTVDGFGVYDDAKLALVRFDTAGRPQPEVSSFHLTGPTHGILTGVSQLQDGWVYSVREPPPDGPREALYVYRDGAVRLIAATPVPPIRSVRLACGISLSPQPPVFWPSLRWAATVDRVAFATTVHDRVVILLPSTGDSVVLEGPAAPVRATRQMAESLSLGLRVSTSRAGCTLSPGEALDQRGMAESRPVIRRLALAPDGDLWLQVDRDRSPPLWRIYGPGAVPDTLTAPAFPGVFLSDSLFVAEGGSADEASLLVWSVRSRN